MTVAKDPNGAGTKGLLMKKLRALAKEFLRFFFQRFLP